MNSKNQLQTYCQRQGIALPKYTSHQDAETKMWLSTVNFNNKSFVGEPQPKKTAADISAADKALSLLVDIQLPNSVIVPDVDSPAEDVCMVNKYKSWDLMLPLEDDMDPLFVLIDYENVNKLDHLHYLYTKDANPAYVCKFVGYCNQKASTDECTHIVHSSGSDAVDHYISFYLGMLYKTLVDRGLHSTVVILTRDKFAAHHRTFCDHNHTFIHCPTEADCIKILTQRGYTKTAKKYCYK